MRARAVVGLVLLGLATLLAACGEDQEQTKAGDVILARADDQFGEGRKSTVTIPDGRLLIRSDDPVDRASADETRTRETVSAPSGAVLVPISWQYDTWASDRLEGIVDTSDTPIVELVADDEHYRLPPPERESETGESFYVVVDGEAEERSLEISFDGVTQTVDLETGSRDEGEAAALYDIEDDRLKKRSCDEEETWFDSRVASAEFSCDLVGPVLTPYAAGEWAPDGSIWLALTLSTRMRIYAETNLFGSGVRYTARSVRIKAEIDGEGPSYELSTNDDADLCPVLATATCGWSKHLVFEVPADDGEQGPLDVAVAFKLVRAAVWGTWDPPRRTKIEAEEELTLWKD